MNQTDPDKLNKRTENSTKEPAAVVDAVKLEKEVVKSGAHTTKEPAAVLDAPKLDKEVLPIDEKNDNKQGKKLDDVPPLVKVSKEGDKLDKEVKSEEIKDLKKDIKIDKEVAKEFDYPKLEPKSASDSPISEPKLKKIDNLKSSHKDVPPVVQAKESKETL